MKMDIEKAQKEFKRQQCTAIRSEHGQNRRGKAACICQQRRFTEEKRRKSRGQRQNHSRKPACGSQQCFTYGAHSRRKRAQGGKSRHSRCARACG